MPVASRFDAGPEELSYPQGKCGRAVLSKHLKFNKKDTFFLLFVYFAFSKRVSFGLSVEEKVVIYMYLPMHSFLFSYLKII